MAAGRRRRRRRRRRWRWRRHTHTHDSFASTQQRALSLSLSNAIRYIGAAAVVVAVVCAGQKAIFVGEGRAALE